MKSSALVTPLSSGAESALSRQTGAKPAASSKAFCSRNGTSSTAARLCTRPAVLHGGAVMAFADTLGAIATIANLPAGANTTTIESKTNFFAAIPLGDVAKGECTPLHRGRTTMVWQTRITRGDGRLAAIVTQTQLVTQRTDDKRQRTE